MKFAKRIIILSVCLAVIVGQVPYGYLYCSFMKQPVSSGMQLKCLRGNQERQRNSAVLSSLFRSQRRIEKATTDRYEGAVYKHIAGDFTASASPGYSLRYQKDFASLSETLPLPDIVISNCSLRI